MCACVLLHGIEEVLARARAGSRRPFIVLVLKAVSQPGWIRMDSASQRYLPAPALAPSQTCGQGIPELMVMALSKVPIAQTKKRPKRCVCCSPFTEKLASNFAVICEIDM